MSATIRRFLDSLVARGCSEHTLAAYQSDLGQLRDYLITSSAQEFVAWRRIGGARLLGFRDFLLEREVASATLARKVAVVKSFFRWLVAEGLIDVDPTDNLTAPKVGQALPHTLTPDEIAALLAAPARRVGPEALRDTAMLRLLYATGVRSSELMALDVGDLDLATDYVRCFGKAERDIPIDAAAHAAIARYLTDARPTLVHFDRADGALFVNHRGARLTRQGFWLILKGHAKAADLPASTTPQMIRSSFAVHHLAASANLRDVQALLGHVNIATTQIYASTLAAERRRVA